MGTDRGYYALRKLLTAALDDLSALPPEELTQRRYRRFRRIGAPQEEET